jgi:alkylation response protein AidB-like acyl-CoA dehydrogenase
MGAIPCWSGVGRTRNVTGSSPATTRAEAVLAHGHPARRLPAETARWPTITQIYEGTNQIQRMVMARQLLK